MNRDRQLRSGLLLAQNQNVVADILASHTHYIGTPLSGVEQEGSRAREPIV